MILTGKMLIYEQKEKKIGVQQSWTLLTHWINIHSMKLISLSHGLIITYELLSDVFLFQIDVVGRIIN